MADSLDDEELRRDRPILNRIVEALCVIAFLFALVLWQSDETLTAVRNLVAAIGFGGSSEPQAMLAVATPTEPALLDRETTGSIPTTAPLHIAVGEAEQAPQAEADLPPVGWRAACDGATPAFCTATQSLTLAGEADLETSWTIEKGKDGLVAVWTTPTDVMVSRGMSLKLGSGSAKVVPFDSCGPHSCEVRAKLASDFLADLRKAGTARTEIMLRGGRAVTFDFSPDGLAEALDKLGV
jgi:invasion protein IalB